jgi:hypothetical protein
MMAHLFCFSSGEMFIGQTVPDGAISFAKGPPKALETIQTLGRLAYNGKTWFVPGIPEANSQEQAGDALEAFLKWIDSRKTFAALRRAS